MCWSCCTAQPTAALRLRSVRLAARHAQTVGAINTLGRIRDLPGAAVNLNAHHLQEVAQVCHTFCGNDELLLHACTHETNTKGNRAYRKIFDANAQT